MVWLWCELASLLFEGSRRSDGCQELQWSPRMNPSRNASLFDRTGWQEILFVAARSRSQGFGLWSLKWTVLDFRRFVILQTSSISCSFFGCKFRPNLRWRFGIFCGFSVGGLVVQYQSTCIHFDFEMVGRCRGVCLTVVRTKFFTLDCKTTRRVLSWRSCCHSHYE